VCAGGVLVDVEKLARHRGRDVTRFANLLMKEKVGGAALRGPHHLRRERRPAPRLQEAQLVLRNSSPGRAATLRTPRRCPSNRTRTQAWATGAASPSMFVDMRAHRVVFRASIRCPLLNTPAQRYSVRHEVAISLS
jgi:hypothetical protein